MVWAAVRYTRPIQFHVGFGDADAVLHRGDPSRLTAFLSATRTANVPVMLLHCYPFIREAGCLAHVFPHVYFDVGAVSHYMGPSARNALRQALEIAPFHKILYSSDAYGLAEHYVVSSWLWRRELGNIFDEWIESDWLTTTEAESLAQALSSGNAREVYGLET